MSSPLRQSTICRTTVFPAPPSLLPGRRTRPGCCSTRVCAAPVRAPRQSRCYDFGSDGSWMCSNMKPDDWETPGFVAEGWAPAIALGDMGMAPWRVSGSYLATRLAGAYPRQCPCRARCGGPPDRRPGAAQPRTGCHHPAEHATTLQALELTNGETLADVLKRGAGNLLASAAAGTDELISALYEKALGRKPTGRELQPRSRDAWPTRSGRRGGRFPLGGDHAPGVPTHLLTDHAPPFTHHGSRFTVQRHMTRRDFIKTASAATLSALARDFPVRLLAGTEEKIKPTADTVIVLWMAGGMAHTETFDPKRYTPFEPGHETRPRCSSTFPPDRHGGGRHQVHRRPGEHRARHGPRHADPLLHRGRSRLHPAFAAPVSLAHRLRAAANRRRAAHRLGDRPHARPARPRRAGLHRHRPALRRRRGRGTESLPHRRLPRQRIRPFIIPYPEDAAQERPPARRDEPRPASSGATRFYRKLLAQSPVGQLGSDYQKESLLRSLDNAHRLLSSPAAKAFDLSLEPEGQLRPIQHGQVRPGLSAGPAAHRGRRPLHRGHHRIHSVLILGHPRKRPHPHGRHEENDRRAHRPARARPRGARPAEPHADRPRQRVQPRHADRRQAGQEGEGPGGGAGRHQRARSTTACTAISPMPAACCCSAAA